MPRPMRSNYEQNRQLALGAATPAPKGRPAKLRTLTAQRAGMWALGLLALAYMGGVLLQ